MQIGRPPEKRDLVMQHVRAWICSGELPPGDRLPSRVVLSRRFGVGLPTLQDAMDGLEAQGFVHSLPRKGTYVAEHPPHIANIGVVFPTGSGQGPSRFFEAIASEAGRYKSAERRVFPFYGVERHVDEEDYQRLLGMVENDRLAGLIFASNPFQLRAMGSPIVSKPGIPRVMIESEADEGGFPALFPDLAMFLPVAFERLALLGRRRVAVVLHTQSDLAYTLRGREPEDIIRLAAEYGLQVSQHRVQAIGAGMGCWIGQLARLLVSGAPGERPDGLVIADDNLVPGVTAGVKAAGLCSPDDLDIVAHANFPYVTTSAMPAIRLGYDISTLVRACLARLDEQRAGQASPAMTRIPAQFEQPSQE